MDVQIGIWGLYPWFPENGPDLIHPDDLEKVMENRPYGSVFRCAGKDEGFLLLKANGFSFRAKPLLFKPVPVPRHQVGDTVAIRKGGQIQLGQVVGIGWHFKNGTHTFAVAIGGKTDKKRYFDSDFVPRT